LIEIRGKIEEIKSLMVNERFNSINPRPRTILQKAHKSRAQTVIHHGLNCIKSKV
jgi:hypothetical protein